MHFGQSIGCMPSAIAELVTSVINATLPGPNHSRTMLSPISALFW